MIRFVFAALLLLHGAIHLIGFAKGFNLRSIPLLTQNISRASGVMWFADSALFIFTAVLFITGGGLWWIAVLIALLVSEVLIVRNWKDAKFGSVINALILLLTLYLLMKK